MLLLRLLDTLLLSEFQRNPINAMKCDTGRACITSTFNYHLMCSNILGMYVKWFSWFLLATHHSKAKRIKYPYWYDQCRWEVERQHWAGCRQGCICTFHIYKVVLYSPRWWKYLKWCPTFKCFGIISVTCKEVPRTSSFRKCYCVMHMTSKKDSCKWNAVSLFWKAQGFKHHCVLLCLLGRNWNLFDNVLATREHKTHLFLPIKISIIEGVQYKIYYYYFNSAVVSRLDKELGVLHMIDNHLTLRFILSLL